MADAVDVSHHQPALNWATIAGGGITAAYIHASYSAHVLDPSLDTHLTQARAAGLATGLVHGSRLRGPANSEAHHFADTINLRDAARPGHLPPCLDLHAADHAELRHRHLSDWIDEFFATLRVATGRRQVLLRVALPVLRTTLSRGAHLDDDVLLWITQYGRDPGHPGIRDPRIVAHHYTDRGRIPDHPGNFSLSHVMSALTALTAGAALDTSTGGWHTVGPGETLRSIAERYRISGGWKQLWDANRDIIADPDIVFAEQKLRLPV